MCEDAAYLYQKADELQKKLLYAQGKLTKFCKTVKSTVDTCDRVRPFFMSWGPRAKRNNMGAFVRCQICKIKKATTSADLILTPLKSLPYIGPVLKVVSPVRARVYTC